ncbi:NUDIX hydrolase [Streptomyces sp. MZ04]|uniref:NUDIX domain-containing protein n=1 Tax=Streptomyces sp. MZ04 TaxID=2559236 RepID=UPI00107EB679|nr:NUDIX hydrolase [Streptomyces sp. MZ04]TGB15411.1 NUDIX hydrolase [Streptomyces sp. MZ04]
MSNSAAAALIQREDGPYGGESPRACCAREGLAEVGVPVQVSRLLAVQWLPGPLDGLGCHLYVFAGRIEPAAYDHITVPAGELLGWDWWQPTSALAVMDETNAGLLTAAVRAAADPARGPGHLEGTEEVGR